jgi:SAM-dependent methyltransferase
MPDPYRADFGNTAEDYATHRAGFPDRFFDEIMKRGIGGAVLDLGTGTGTLARGLAARGARVTGIDIAPAILAQARGLAAAQGLEITFSEGSAEDTGRPDDAFDAVTAGQCWHWFDGAAACEEIARVLRPGGFVCICHFDWLPLPGSVVAATEALILHHSPDWPFANGTGLYPAWLPVLSDGGFVEIETFSFDHAQTYSHDAWRGRIRASAPIGGSLDAAGVAAFESAHAAMLARDFPQDPLTVPHRCWAAIARYPGE